MNRKYNLKVDRKPVIAPHLFVSLPQTTALPNIVDLRNKWNFVYDQGAIGSCTSVAICSLIKADRPTLTPSRLFLYYNERALDGDIQDDAGSTLTQGVNALVHYGICQESLWPYNVNKFADSPPQVAFTDGMRHRIGGYRHIPQDLGSIKTALHNRIPFVLGIQVYASFESDHASRTGMIPYPNKMGDIAQVPIKRTRAVGGFVIVTASEVILPGRRKGFCENTDCIKRASFNHRGQTNKRFCAMHKETGMINVRDKQCEHTDCESVTPHFNHRGQTKGRFCGKHKEPGMIDVKHRQCEHADCESLMPCFNYRGQTKGRFCSIHQEPGMINVKDKQCEHFDCESRPSFNHRGQTKGRFCATHKEPDMIDVISNTCEHAGCDSQPCFNHRGQTKARFCATHKELDMIDVKSKRCEHTGCESQPFFNRRGQTKGRFCGKHKEPGMIDIKNKRCEHADCESRPSFNHRGQTKGRFCGKHKEPGMINVKNKRCEHAECDSVTPSFNYPNHLNGRFCSKHKEAGMVDVRNKRCEHPECDIMGPSYGEPGHRPIHCASHRKEGMIRNSFTKCMEPNCKDPAIYGIHRAVHCTLHVVAGESNLTGKVCTKCGLIDVVDAHGRCNDCDPQAFRRYRLAKQREVKAMLDNSEHKNYVLYDRIIDGGECGKERPDWMWDCGTHQLILECDENNGHKTREEWCECTRMVNISQSAGMPVVFLRYNPDSFVRNGKARNETMNKRRDILFRWIAHLKKTPPVHFLSVMQLFYDEYKEGNESLECILQFDT